MDWASVWTDVLGGNARGAFTTFVEDYPRVRSYAARMLIVGRLVHAVHVSGNSVVRNLIEEHAGEVLTAQPEPPCRRMMLVRAHVGARLARRSWFRYCLVMRPENRVSIKLVIQTNKCLRLVPSSARCPE